MRRAATAQALTLEVLRLEGIIGLFIGAVVLAVGHDLFRWWLDNPPEPTETSQQAGS